MRVSFVLNDCLADFALLRKICTARPMRLANNSLELKMCISLQIPSTFLHSTPDGNLRFFVEHWHGDLANATEAGTMQIRVEETGQPPEQKTLYADDIINDWNPYGSSGATGWGCVNDETPEIVTTCTRERNVRDQKKKRDW